MAGRNVLIAPSILSADFACLADDVRRVERAGADWLHIDVMDGHFVPNLTIGPAVVANIRKRSRLLFDVHLMIERPDLYWERFAKAGADLVTFHLESGADPRRLIRALKKAGLKAGISVRPKTGIRELRPLLPLLDLVLIMTVEPGFGGQAFMQDMMPKLAAVRELIDRSRLPCRLQVDGGINAETGSEAVRFGADVLVAGNAIFAASDPAKALKDIRRVADGVRAKKRA